MRIGIVRRNGLGDLLTAVPLILLCKERYPSHVTLFVDPRNAPLLPFLKGIDHSIVIDDAKNKYISLVKTVWKQRNLSFDLVLSARPTPMKWVNLFLSGLKSRHRRAVVDGGWHSRWIDEPLPYEPYQKCHQAVKALQLLDRSIEEVPLHLRPQLDIHPSFHFHEPTLLVSVTNRRVGSQLDGDKIADHLNRAFEKQPFAVIVNGEPKERVGALQVQKELKMKSQVIITSTLDQFLPLLASVDGLWTGDGGAMHLMAALNKPQLVLFGKTEIWEWGPLSEKAICLRDPHNVNLIPKATIQTELERLIHGLR